MMEVCLLVHSRILVGYLSTGLVCETKRTVSPICQDLRESPVSKIATYIDVMPSLFIALLQVMNTTPRFTNPKRRFLYRNHNQRNWHIIQKSSISERNSCSLAYSTSTLYRSNVTVPALVRMRLLGRV